MSQQIVQFIFSHFPLILLILAIVLSLIVVMTKSQTTEQAQNINTFIALMMLLPVGIGGLWGFIMHAFFPTIAASFIGWSVSPFQFEVAVANLGVGLAGVISYAANTGFRSATTLITTCFLWGAAIGHIRQLIIHHNFSKGNIGAIFYTDCIIPLILIILLLLYKRNRKSVFR